MQGGICVEPVVRLHPQGVLSRRDIPRQRLKTGIRAVMLRQQRAVHRHPGPEADAAQPQAHVAARGDLLLIHAPAPVFSQGGMGFPYAGDDDLFGPRQPARVRGGQRPNRGAFPAFADHMGFKYSFHESILVSFFPFYIIHRIRRDENIPLENHRIYAIF